jgi:hypothetical protein
LELHRHLLIENLLKGGFNLGQSVLNHLEQWLRTHSNPGNSTVKLYELPVLNQQRLSRARLDMIQHILPNLFEIS